MEFQTIQENYFPPLYQINVSNEQIDFKLTQRYISSSQNHSLAYSESIEQSIHKQKDKLQHNSHPSSQIQIDYEKYSQSEKDQVSLKLVQDDDGDESEDRCSSIINIDYIQEKNFERIDQEYQKQKKNQEETEKIQSIQNRKKQQTKESQNSVKNNPFKKKQLAKIKNIDIQYEINQKDEEKSKNLRKSNRIISQLVICKVGKKKIEKNNQLKKSLGKGNQSYQMIGTNCQLYQQSQSANTFHLSKNSKGFNVEDCKIQQEDYIDEEEKQRSSFTRKNRVLTMFNSTYTNKLSARTKNKFLLRHNNKKLMKSQIMNKSQNFQQNSSLPDFQDSVKMTYDNKENKKLLGTFTDRRINFCSYLKQNQTQKNICKNITKNRLKPSDLQRNNNNNNNKTHKSNFTKKKKQQNQLLKNILVPISLKSK